MPVPPALGLCTDDEVNGAPFYVMGFVDGVVLDSVEKAEQLPIELRRQAAEHLIDVLADLHAVDIDAVGPRRLRQAHGLHRAAGEAMVDAVGELQDPRAGRHRRGRRRACATTSPTQHGVVDRPRRLPLRQLPHRRRTTAASPPCSTGSCARWATRSPTSATSACTGSTASAANVRANDPTSAGGFPSYDELLAALRGAHRSRPSAASTTTSPSRAGGWPSSARACTPATCTVRWAIRRSTSSSSRSGVDALAERALDAVRRLA